MKKNKIKIQKIKKVWKKQKEKRNNIYNLEYEKIKKMNERDFILNYTEIKSKYKFYQNVKYLLNSIVISILGFLGYTLYKLAKSYFINYTTFNVEQKEIVTITLIILSGLLVIFIFSFLIIIYLYLKRLKNIERKLNIYEEIKGKNNNG